MRSLILVVLLCAFVAACGGGDEELEATVPPPEDAAEVAPAVPEAGGGTIGAGQAETFQDIPLTLNLDEPLPPDFKAAYQRRALIVVEFFKEDQDTPYPQGLEVDNIVSGALQDLRPDYPTVEFFSYNIADPGSTADGEELKEGEYGTLAAQLGVEYTPFVATLAPGADEYTIDNLYQGYLPRPVLNQSLFDLTSIDIEGNTSDINVTLERVALTETGGGIEYFTVRNATDRAVNLQGFSLRLLDPETSEVSPDSDGVLINDEVDLGPEEQASIGRVPDVQNADGQPVNGTFEGGDALDLAPGDQLALLDSGGAVADTFVV